MPLGARRYVIGGSDPRITLGDDKTILMRLWREKHPEAEPDNLPRKPAEKLNRRWYEGLTRGVPIGTYFCDCLLCDGCNSRRLCALEFSSHPGFASEQRRGFSLLDLLQMGEFLMTAKRSKNRRYFIGGSDAPIIMGNDELALVR